MHSEKSEIFRIVDGGIVLVSLYHHSVTTQWHSP